MTETPKDPALLKKLLIQRLSSEPIKQDVNNVSALLKLSQDMNDLASKFTQFDQLGSTIKELGSKIDDLIPVMSDQSTDDQIVKGLETVNRTLSAKDYNPTINVASPSIPKLDLSPISETISHLEGVIKANKPNLDLSEVVTGLQSVKDTLASLSFPVPNYVLPYKTGTANTATQASAVATTLDATKMGVVVVNADGTSIGGGAGGALSTAAKGATTAGSPTSTNASVDRQLLDVTLRDTAGNPVSVGGGTQFADGTARGTATGTLMMVDDGTNIQSAIGTSAGVLKVDISATTANATAVKVDGSAVTQPVSGTVTTSPPANASTNVAQVAGTATDTNSGLKSAGTLRVVLATDQPQLTNKLLVTPDSVALPANQSVNVSQVNGVTTQTGVGASGTGTQRVAVASDSTLTSIGSITSALPTGANVIGQVSVNQTTQGTTDAVSLKASTGAGTTALTKDDPSFGDGVTSGILATSKRLFNGTNYDRARSGGVTGMQGVVAQASPSGGYTPGHLVSAATTNATSVKASAGTLGHVSASNVNAAARYLKFYNKASAPTVGTDVPVLTYIIPGNTSGAGTNIPLPPQGIAFSTGIAFAITTEATDAGSTAVAASEIVINYGWI